MKREKKGWFYIVAAVFGFIMAAYYVVELKPQNIAKLEWGRSEILFALATCILIASVLNFLFGFAMVFGQVDRVLGSRESASIVIGNGVMRDKRIGFVVRLHPEASDDGERIVLFMIGLRPWICPADKFLR